MEFELYNRKLKFIDENTFYVYRDYGKYKNNIDWYLINISNGNDGYRCFRIGDKKIKVHRIVAYLFLGLDIEDATKQVDHINGIRNDNRKENLRIVNNQINQWNRLTAKGYTFDKRSKKYRAVIVINMKHINLGSFNIEEEARQAYLDAKQKYHIIEEVFQ
jgi:hypothetical protein